MGLPLNVMVSLVDGGALEAKFRSFRRHNFPRRRDEVGGKNRLRQRLRQGGSDPQSSRGPVAGVARPRRGEARLLIYSSGGGITES